MAKIICPICDEELGSCIDDVPEKCPICDTRKHEILLELKSKEDAQQPQFNASAPQPAPEPERSPVIEEEHQPEPVAEESNDEVVFTDLPTSLPESHSIPKGPTIVPVQEPKEESQEAEEDIIIFAKEPEPVRSEPSAIPEQISLLNEAAPVELRSSEPAKPEADDEESTESSPSPISLPKAKTPAQQPSKSGASSLETLPFGFRYCTQCRSVYPKEYQEACICKNTKLEIAEKGFPPGHYLILYNSQRKAIAYFRLTLEGSIFIGRSSERGSDRDIDLSVAWKHYYYRNAKSEEEFKDQMRLLKGISRKHALIRFDQDTQQFILFHLSDKNYTVAQLPNGEKRIRPPQNRNRIDLVNETLVSMGNQKDFIVMRYKELVWNADK